MRTLLISALILAAGCVSSTAGGGSTTIWDQAVKCGVDEGGSTIADVSSVLLEGSGTAMGPAQVSELEQLALQHSTHAISCLVQQLINDWTRPGAAPVPERLDAAARGKDFLRQKGVTVEAPQ